MPIIDIMAIKYEYAVQFLIKFNLYTNIAKTVSNTNKIPTINFTISGAVINFSPIYMILRFKLAEFRIPHESLNQVYIIHLIQSIFYFYLILYIY